MFLWGVPFKSFSLQLTRWIPILVWRNFSWTWMSQGLMRLCPLLPQEPSGIVPEFNKWIGWATGNWENLVYHFSMSAYKWVYVLVWYPSNSKMYTVDLNKKGVLFAFQEWRWNNFFTNTNPKKSWSIMVVITLMLREVSSIHYFLTQPMATPTKLLGSTCI